MMSDADDVSRALEGTALQGKPVLPGEGGALMIGDIDPARVLESWRAARGVVAHTGRWPVAVDPEWWYSDLYGLEQVELEAQVAALDESQIFERWMNDEPIALDGGQWIDDQFPGGGLSARIVTELPDPVLEYDLERWIHERLTEHPSLVDCIEERLQWDVGTRAWYTPSSVNLALLPTASPALAGAWPYYYGSESGPALVAALQHWNTLWGAELVASWGTMLQFTVRRRPQPGDEAWELAGQHLAWAGSLQRPQWHLAQVLTRSDTWYFHDRP